MSVRRWLKHHNANSLIKYANMGGSSIFILFIRTELCEVKMAHVMDIAGDSMWTTMHVCPVLILSLYVVLVLD